MRPGQKRRDLGRQVNHLGTRGGGGERRGTATAGRDGGPGGQVRSKREADREADPETAAHLR